MIKQNAVLTFQVQVAIDVVDSHIYIPGNIVGSGEHCCSLVTIETYNKHKTDSFQNK